MNTQPWTGADFQMNNALPINANYPFWYMHHPNTCWEFTNHKNTWYFLPTFRRLFEMAGVNGVRMVPHSQGGGTDSGMARVRMMDNGFQVLDWEMGYQTRYKTKTGGYYYCHMWQTPKTIGNRVIWKTDIDAFNDWKLELLKNGVINYPDVDILEFFVEKQKKRCERNEGKNMTKRLQQQYDNDVLKLQMMEKYIEIGGPVQMDGKPIKKGRKRNV